MKRVVDFITLLAVFFVIGVIGSALICSVLFAQKPDTLRGRNFTKIEQVINGVRHGKVSIQSNRNYHDRAKKKFRARQTGIEYDSGKKAFRNKSGSGFTLNIQDDSRAVVTRFGSDSIVSEPLRVNNVRPKINKDGQVIYVDLWDGVDLILTKSRRSTKEDIVIKRPARTRFDFRLKLNSAPERIRGGARIGNLYIASPEAHDADGIKLPLDFGYTHLSGTDYDFFMNVDTSGAAYPIIIDPSVSDTITYGQGAQMFCHSGTYSTARGATAATTLDTAASGWAVGPQFAGAVYYVRRTVLKFDLGDLPGMAAIDSVKITLSAKADNSTTDFTWTIVSSHFSAVGVAAFNDFPGWQTGTTAYTPGHLIDSVSTSAGWTPGTDYTIKMVSAAADTVESQWALDDTLRLHFLSWPDIRGQSGTYWPDNSRIEFDSHNGDDPPELDIYYHLRHLPKPAGLALRVIDGSTIAIDSVQVQAQSDTLTDGLMFYIRHNNANQWIDANGDYRDNRVGLLHSEIKATILLGVSPNTLHHFYVQDSSGTADSSTIDSASTGDPSAGGLSFFGTLGDSIYFAMYDTSRRRFVVMHRGSVLAEIRLEDAFPQDYLFGMVESALRQFGFSVERNAGGEYAILNRKRLTERLPEANK